MIVAEDEPPVTGVQFSFYIPEHPSTLADIYTSIYIIVYMCSFMAHGYLLSIGVFRVQVSDG